MVPGVYITTEIIYICLQCYYATWSEIPPSSAVISKNLLLLNINRSPGLQLKVTYESPLWISVSTPRTLIGSRVIGSFIFGRSFVLDSDYVSFRSLTSKSSKSILI